MSEMNGHIASELASNDVATGLALAFPPAPVSDEGRIQIGAQSPMFVPAAIADAGFMRIGAQSPAF